ncbi:thioredoxin family protein [Porticoccaceae bacterium LTM1]|nr:thioredoxin family protein [Porticoccaceae bacterium LTM1]
MKKSLFLIASLLFSSSAFSAGIEFFHGTWEEALEKAKSEEKLIFVDVYTDWCGPCKKMAKTIFTQDRVGEYYNANFINYKLNAEDEEQNGPELAEQYEVRAYPTLLYIDGTGNLAHRATGYKDAFPFIQEGKKATGDLRSLAELEKDYQAGRRDGEFIKAYLLGAKAYDESFRMNEELVQLAKEYFDAGNPTDWINEEDYTIGVKYFRDRKDRFIAFLFDHYSDFAKVISPEQLASKISQINTSAIQASASNGDIVYREYLEDIKGSLADVYKLSGMNSDIAQAMGLAGESLEEVYDLHRLAGNRNYALSKSQWSDYLQLSEEYLAKLGKNAKSHQYMGIVRDLLNAGCKDTKVLGQVEPYAKKAMQDKSYKRYAIPHYAILLARLGQKETARSMLEDMIAKAKKAGDKRMLTFAERSLEEVN